MSDSAHHNTALELVLYTLGRLRGEDRESIVEILDDAGKEQAHGCSHALGEMHAAVERGDVHAVADAAQLAVHYMEGWVSLAGQAALYERHGRIVAEDQCVRLRAKLAALTGELPVWYESPGYLSLRFGDGALLNSLQLHAPHNPHGLVSAAIRGRRWPYNRGEGMRAVEADYGLPACPEASTNTPAPVGERDD